MNGMIIHALIEANFYPDFPGYERQWIDGDDPMYYPKYEPNYEICDVCDGNGRFYSDILNESFTCPACNGRGDLLIEPEPIDNTPLTLEQAREKFEPNHQEQKLIAVYGHPHPVSIADYWERVLKKRNSE